MSASSPRISAASAVLVAAYAVVAAGLFVGSLGWPLIHDAPIMHYIAWRIGHGAVPYRDLFDMNFPGTYLVHLAVLRTVGSSDAAWRAFDLAWLAATALALVAFARPWGWIAAAGSALFFAVYHLSGGAWLAGQRDFFLVIFLVLGALGVVRWASETRRANLAWSGLLLGAGLTIKPHAALFAGALVAVILVVSVRRGSAVAAPLATFLGAMLVMPAAVAGWIAAAGGAPAWRDVVLHYLIPYYVRLGRPTSWAFHRWHVWIPIAAAVALALAHAVRARRFTVRHAIVVLGIAYGLVHYVAQGKGWEYHLYPLAAFAALLTFAEGGPALAQRRLLGVPLAASLALALILLAQRGVEAANAGWIRQKDDLVREVTRDLGTLAPGETVQVLDTTDGGIHVLLRLGALQPTRFLYDFHFFHDEGVREIRALRAELIRDLAARPPRFIVIFDRGWPVGGPERIARFPELEQWLGERYRARPSRPGYTVYEKRRDP
jgi:hypothetical protein